jgi:hypothetical protein
MHTFFITAGNVTMMQFPPLVSRVFLGDLVHNTPVLSLIFANIITIIIAILGNWDLATVMFIYWAQSIIIGFFIVMGILLVTVPPPAPDREQPAQQPLGPRTIYLRNPWVAKCFRAGSCVLPYGIFHGVYYSFIVNFGLFGVVHFSDPGIWLSCGLFFANHFYSFIAYDQQRFQDGADITGQIFIPFKRILPMHMTIIFGGIFLLILEFVGIRSTLPVLVLFLILKTGSDVSAHIEKHQQGKYSDGITSGV